MRSFEYGDQEISTKEMAIAIASMIIGVGAFTLPRLVAETAKSSDGWIPILLSGAVALVFAWVAAKLTMRFPGLSFREYTGLIVTKPIAALLTFVMSGYFLMFTAYEVRAIADISKEYLFNKTPIEVIALAFLLVVVYAVSRSRAGLFRLNMLFLPIVMSVIMLVLFASIGFFEFGNLKPYFATDWKGLLQGGKASIFSLMGFEIVLFYAMLMNRPKQAPKAVLIGTAIPVPLYIFIYICSIGVFSVEATSQIEYPTIELAKEIRIPGEFFERMESLFFVIWTMTIFNTACMALDISIMALSSLFNRIGKFIWIILLSPLSYIIAMTPQDMVEFASYASMISYSGVGFGFTLPVVLLLVAKLRGVKGNG
jgi:spore germination protein